MRMRKKSLPSRERGLKLRIVCRLISSKCVAPFAGAWIEIPDGRLQRPELLRSLPSRERGLKSIWNISQNYTLLSVAPFAGAWIEIAENHRAGNLWNVAPFAGAWIEIRLLDSVTPRLVVAPFAGAWIEIA